MIHTHKPTAPAWPAFLYPAFLLPYFEFRVPAPDQPIDPAGSAGTDKRVRIETPETKFASHAAFPTSCAAVDEIGSRPVFIESRIGWADLDAGSLGDAWLDRLACIGWLMRGVNEPTDIGVRIHGRAYAGGIHCNGRSMPSQDGGRLSRDWQRDRNERATRSPGYVRTHSSNSLAAPDQWPSV